MIRKILKIILPLFLMGNLWSEATSAANKPTKAAPAAKKNDAGSEPKIISKKDFVEALKKLAKDERVPVASSTLVEKGRGAEYYSVEKAFDGNLETFWAEGASGTGKNEWIAFHIPDESTHVEVVPGAGKEQFENFNRPKSALLDIYLVKLKQEDGEYQPTFKWLARVDFAFQNKNTPVRQKIPVKLPELAAEMRTLYVGVLILQDVYKGQFDDTSIAEIRASAVWGEK